MTTETEQDRIESQARRANAADLWDGLWSKAETRDWRKEALSRVYNRIERLLPKGSTVIDIGGGVGDLGHRLADARGATVEVVDHSPAALEIASSKDLMTHLADLEESPQPYVSSAGAWVVSTELLEHLSRSARSSLLEQVSISIYDSPPSGEDYVGAMFSVPNARLGPEDEHQHTIEFTAITFAAELREHFKDVRVEVQGPFLLGLCGAPFRKGFTLSMCLPVRDEARDLEAVLASFRGVADQIVVGVDPRTVDETWSIAEKYADLVFFLEDPSLQNADHPDHDPSVPLEGVHFSWCRNQCLDRCEGDWIFMTEGHERLLQGSETLLALDRIMPEQAQVGFVFRQGANQRWGYPWLYKRECGFRYERATHNELRYPSGTNVVKLPQIVTLHERHHENAAARAEQRRVQNRVSLEDDWKTNENAASLFYFAQELRQEDPDAAIDRFEEFLDLDKARANGLTRYQARLELCKLYSHRAQNAKTEEAEAEAWAACRKVLSLATSEDWSRTEHWVWLGDLAFKEGQLEEALQFYRYASTVLDSPPFTLWWVDLACYSYLPAQRLAMCYGHLGQAEQALKWARRVVDLLPVEARAEAFDEARSNVKLLEGIIDDASS